MLRVLCRSYGGENMKDRPAYYSKLLCLASLVRAAQAAGAELAFLNDGPVPADRLALMEASGEVHQLPGVGMRRSYVAGFEFATSGRWADDDLVWFSEDDYLYAPDSLVALDRARAAMPEVDYFALYAATTDLPIVGAGEEAATFPARWRELPPWRVGEQDWVRIQSTASTFGAVVSAVREDLGIIKFCMVPHRTMYRDHDTALVYQGFEPYTWRSIARDAVLASGSTPRERVREAAMAPFRLATNLRSHRRDDRRRLLVAAQPNLATHLEATRTSPGTDWAALARATADWAGERGVPLTGPTAGAPGER